MNPRILTKSKYVTFLRCPKKAWYDEFVNIQSPQVTQASKNGTRVGEIARHYFGEPKLLDKNDPMPHAPGNYAEAPLKYKKLFCAVDIFKINDDKSVDIYEVKSVTSHSNDGTIQNGEISNIKIEPKYLYDMSFQYYVAEKCGYKINSINLMTLDKNYIYDGSDYKSDAFLKGIFIITDCTKQVLEELCNVENNIKEFFKLDDSKEPGCKLSGYCNENDGCVHLDKCKQNKGLPLQFSVYDLYDYQGKYGLIEDGITKFSQLYTSEKWDELTEFNKRLINFQLLNITEPYIDKEDLQKFIKKIKFPIYFFDFETVSDPIPMYANSRSYQQIPFQYSLHVMNSSGENIDDVKSRHDKFLGDGGSDPREELIKQMINQLGSKGTIIAYNDVFEKTRIKELSRDFPKYSKKLDALLKRFVDLKDVFDYKKEFADKYIKAKENNKNKKDAQGNQVYEKATFSTSMVYLKDIYNSTSIKNVLPALYPNNTALNYHSLNQVHNGDEASQAYLELAKLKGREKDELMENMRKYCFLDTYAMVAIYFKLLEYIK